MEANLRPTTLSVFGPEDVLAQPGAEEGTAHSIALGYLLEHAGGQEEPAGVQELGTPGGGAATALDTLQHRDRAGGLEGFGRHALIGAGEGKKPLLGAAHRLPEVLAEIVVALPRLLAHLLEPA